MVVDQAMMGMAIPRGSRVYLSIAEGAILNLEIT
jgi:hypothetical protein